jgi:prepilin-type N-terminal cleavage/methylation domain-containing protein
MKADVTPGSRRRPRADAGFTLIEILMSGAVLAVAACGLSAVLVNSMAASAVNKETAQARAAARQMLEQLQNIPVSDVYATFNGITNDDPLGEGTAPGGAFVIHTKPAAIQVSNMTGEILFPGDSKSGVLSEDVKDPALGMPMDLNGDGVIDGENHSSDYLVLPVKIRVRWQGVAGERTFVMCSMLLND